MASDKATIIYNGKTWDIPLKPYGKNQMAGDLNTVMGTISVYINPRKGVS